VTSNDSEELAAMRQTLERLSLTTKAGLPLRPLLLSVVETAKVLGLSRRIVEARVIPQLTTVRFGTRRLVPIVELERYVDGLITEAAAGRTTPVVGSNTAERKARIDAFLVDAQAKARANRTAA